MAELIAGVYEAYREEKARKSRLTDDDQQEKEKENESVIICLPLFLLFLLWAVQYFMGDVLMEAICLSF